MINHAVFGLAAFRTPTSVRYAASDRPIERGPVGASLSAGDYFAQCRLDHFSPEIFISRGLIYSGFQLHVKKRGAYGALAALVFTQRKAARAQGAPYAPRRRAAYPFR